MEWSDDAIVLALRRHGESAAIASLLTRAHGRHAGLVHGGAGRSQRAVLEPGNRVRARWRARLSEHLGHFVCEPVEARAAALLDDPLRLSVLAAATAVAEAALPERLPYPRVYDGLDALLDGLVAARGEPAVEYVRWELGLLAELGFGLDLRRSVAGEEGGQLAYVSPRSGRAVSREAGAEHAGRLLPLPGFLAGAAAAGPGEVLSGLGLTGHFLRHHVFSTRGDPSGTPSMPAARERLAARLAGGSR